jgi:peptidylprolyl isomerase
MRTHTLIRGAVVAAVAVFALGTAACGSSGGSGGTASTAAGPTVTIGSSACGIKVTSTMSTKPAVTVPDCATKPEAFAVKTITPGSGPAVQAGQNVVVKYVGIAWSTKQQFDASWDRNPDTFTVAGIGNAQVIMGWNLGLQGVHVGSRVLLELPPDMGYGPSGTGPIGPDETLLFVVDVISATGGATQ